MAIRHKTNYSGVFWRESKTNGKKDKTYYIVYKNENNKTVESKIGKESHGVGVKYAHIKYIETINNIRLGEEVPVKRKRRKIYTFYDAYCKYIDYTKNNKKTWKKDKEHFNNHLKEFHHRELTSLTQLDFNTLKIDKLKKYSQSTVKHILAVARQIINYSINNEFIKNYSNPISTGRVHMKQPNNEKLGFFTKEQAKILLDELKENYSERIYNLTAMLLFTGARFSEVASLTWHDIDFNTNLIYFKSTKNGNSRYISMTPLVKNIINSLDREHILIFPSSNGKQMIQMPRQWQDEVDRIIPNNKIKNKKIKNKTFTQAEKELIEKQKKYRLTIHSLRHTHASWMAISNEFSLLEIQKQLGHKTLQMTQRYAHLMESDRHRKHNSIFNDFY